MPRCGTGDPEGEERPKPGPEPERLKIDREDWEEAVREAMEKEKPEDGWPEESEDKDDGRGEPDG